MDQAGDTTGRLAWVDVAKGICILLVVMMHSVTGTGEAMGGEGFLHAVVAFAKPFRIPDFFLLSGLFMGRVIGRDWRPFADRRVVHQLAAEYSLTSESEGEGRDRHIVLRTGGNQDEAENKD